MHSSCLIQILLALSSFALSNQDLMGSGVSCVRSSATDDGLTRVTFLREETTGVRTLYLSLWSDEDQRLITCEVDSSPLVTERYLVLCDQGSSRRQEIIQRFNISMLLVPDAPCALSSSGAQKFSRHRGGEGRGKPRRRRGVIFPGTLWCGTGSRANGYEDLGMFESADKCCREHDHCQHIIPSFTRNYGVFNSKFYTVSHCDCDQRFRQCLLRVNDTISSMVGYSFFSILQVPCFELKLLKRCTTMYWWGMCKTANVAPYAIFKNPLPFNTSDITTRKHGDDTDSNKIAGIQGQQVTKSPEISTKSPKTDYNCSSRNLTRGDTLQHKKHRKGCRKRQKLSTEPSTQISKEHNTTSLVELGLSSASESNMSVSIKKRVGKKKTTRKDKQKSHNPLNVTTILYPHATSTMLNTLSSTSMQERGLVADLTSQAPPLHISISAVIPAGGKSLKRDPKQSHCCEFGSSQKGDAFQPDCKRCLNLKRTSQWSTVTPSTTTKRLLKKILTKLQMTEEKGKKAVLKKIWSRDTSTKPKQVISIPKEREAQELMNSHQVLNSTRQESVDGAESAEKGPNENHLLCGSLKHLDECQYKILPLEKKFGLQNGESKTAYHCDCTRRLALQIKTFKQPGILPTLLVDFVSQNCFELPKEKKCHREKSCSGGFTKASDLLRALKKIKGKDTAVVRNSVNDRKRGTPVRLSKRCLRLQREADTMAQLTRL